ncbi:MAG TPA: nucleotidyltransferase family protein [Gaiellaceae bacterium]|nr:nucleotidyltransferase family protein [Gaiellaceae bacterium]
MRAQGVGGAFWPNTVQHELLRIALGPVDEAAARWRQLQPVDMSALPPGSFGLLPLLYERLTELAPDEPQLPLLVGTYRNTWYRNKLLADRLARLLPLLREHGVEALVVGGAALQRWYPAPGSRSSSPLELIVPPPALPAVRAACVAAGWRPAGAWRSYVRFVDEGAPLVVHAGVPAQLAGALGAAEAYGLLRSEAVEGPSAGGAPLFLGVADQLLLLCAMAPGPGRQGSCQWLIDVHHVLTSEARPPAEALLARARRLAAVEPLRSTLLYLARNLGSPGLEKYADAAASIRGGRRERVAFFLAGAPVGRLAAVTQLLGAHVRRSSDQPLFRVVGGLPGYLQDRWGTASLAETLKVGARKTARVLAASRQRARSARNPSASSQGS